MMMSNRSPRPLLAASFLTSLLALAGCSEQSSDEPAAGGESASSSGAPSGMESRPRPRPRGPLDVEVRMIPAVGEVAADTPATLRGVARIEGPVPVRTKISMSHIPGCSGHDEQLTETVMASEDGLLQNVFVYVMAGVDRESIEPAPEEPVVLEQSSCLFRPHIVTLRAGQTLLVQNKDDTHHNVRARPQHGSNRAFNKTQPAGGADMEVVFPRAEIGIAFSCDLHPWMKSYVCVVDHSHHALSDEAGRWSIELAPGKYVVEAWHERFGLRKVQVTVGPGETAELDFVYETKKKKKK